MAGWRPVEPVFCRCSAAQSQLSPPVSEGCPSRPHAACHLTTLEMGRRKQGVPRKADGQDPNQPQPPASENEGENALQSPACCSQSPITCSVCQWNLAKVGDIVKSFAWNQKCQEIFGRSVSETDLTFKRRSRLSRLTQV